MTTSRPRRVGVAKCSIVGCDQLVKARGWCAGHYSRWQRHGSATARLIGEVVDDKRICRACKRDKPLDAFRRQNDACRDCEADRQRAYLAAKPRALKARTRKTCEVCGAAFLGNGRQYRHCSPACQVQGERDGIWRYTQQRRAALKALPSEDFTAREIYERDSWICGLCGEPINREARTPHADSPSIDHVLPVARGGGHTRGNVQAAHLGCNRRKGARVLDEAAS